MAFQLEALTALYANPCSAYPCATYVQFSEDDSSLLDLGGSRNSLEIDWVDRLFAASFRASIRSLLPTANHEGDLDSWHGMHSCRKQ
jgi:hypothetical protein